MSRRAGYAVEAAAAWLLYAFFSLLPVDAASAFGGWIGRMFGPSLRVSNNARHNLKSVYPNWNNQKIEKVILDMWDNLGRTAGEHPHLSKFDPYQENSRVEVVGAQYCDLLKSPDFSGLFFGGHIANWEIVPLAGTRRGINVHIVYRRANNPFFDKLVLKRRKTLGAGLYPKGAESVKDIMRALKRGENLAMLVDQKMNDGITVPFLGRDAMTAPALAELALRYDSPIVPARVERLEGTRFRVTFYPPLERPNTGDRNSDILAIMTEVNQQLGNWINARPEQWLWVHNRWPD